MTLRLRRMVDDGPHVEAAALSGSRALLHRSGRNRGFSLLDQYAAEIVRDDPEDTLITADGAAICRWRTGDDGVLDVSVDLDDRLDAVRARFPDPQAGIGVREHAGLVTLADSQGRVVVLEPEGVGLVSEFRTRIS
ncbi:MAG: hypothetical protein J0H43_11635 [Actinobacteria bacterium]|nr:hypothetical protein [Actinomycetota bacterium]